jgi:sRNA-binding carbon storage regulator CsrA
MPLKLTVGARDKITLSCGVVIDVRTLSDKQVQLEFTAPRSIKIHAIFNDSRKQFKNARKMLDKATQRAAESDSQVNQPSVEEQRKAALQRVLNEEK